MRRLNNQSNPRSTKGAGRRKENRIMNGPFEIELKIRLTDGKRSAIAAYSMIAGVYPTKEKIQQALGACVIETQKQIGPEWRLQNRHEFENEVMSDRYGGHIPEFSTDENWEA
jgi:hypothetical protein